MSWTHAARTDVGRLRTQNEDAWFAEPAAGAFGVADGLGGHAAGEVASRMAVELIADRLVAADDGSIEERKEALRRAIREANAEIHREANRAAERAGMGTTVTALAVAPDGSYAIGHVGDSRAYLLRGGEMHRLTRDHTYVQELVEQGRLDDEEARLHPRSSVLTRALGLDGEVQVDVYEGRLREGDRLLLTTDGLTGMLPDRRVAELLSVDAPADAAGRLVEAANEAGGADNITVLVLDIAASPVEEPA